MGLLRASFLLFGLNLLDALLTIAWIRNGIATEGNALMATLLEIGDVPFLAVKIAIGALTVLVVALWGNRRVARYGLSVALGAYLGLMVIHLATGMAAVGYDPVYVLHYFDSISYIGATVNTLT